jgi:aminoglycoside phosphotransferase (APT) family kinase protein
MDREIGRVVERLVPGGRIVEVRRLRADRALEDDTHKSAGYGDPRRVRVATPDGERSFVFHVQRADGFGHDRRADRAADQLLAFDTFGHIPRHARALDVGAVRTDGTLVSLAETGELYLVTEWVEGTPYAEDLRGIARAARLGPIDLARADALCDYLVALHAHRPPAAAGYRRSVRDLVGSGEGLFGMIDAYPADTPGAPPDRLRAIEHRCLDWRWRLRAHEGRITRTHGDFHPFNIVFQDAESFRLLDASRGCAGDPADDVAALAINFVFFALDHAGAWPGAMRMLFQRFLLRYVERTGDDQLLDVLAPWFAWRGLVVASPAFYPDLPGAARDRLLRFVERALDAPRFDLAFADEVFA